MAEIVEQLQEREAAQVGNLYTYFQRSILQKCQQLCLESVHIHGLVHNLVSCHFVVLFECVGRIGYHLYSALNPTMQIEKYSRFTRKEIYLIMNCKNAFIQM